MQGEHPLKVKLLADDYVKVYESPDPDNVYTYSPGIAVLASGRLVATMDMSGPGMDKVAGPKQVIEHGSQWFGKVFVSDDGGRTWVHKTDFPFMHARPFVADGKLYVLGHCNELMIIRSDDDGETWSEPAMLSTGVGEVWHQAPSNVHYAKGNVYLVMERITVPTIKAHPVSVMAPVMMRAAEASDLTRRESWTFASELVFRDAIDERELDYFGVPFYQAEREASVLIAPPRRRMSPVGWLETNVVQFTDPAHYFHDPAGRTFHLWMRANTGGTGFALVAKVVENEDGTMTTMLEKVPSGRTIAFVPCPGGQMKFHILHDPVGGLYWLLSTQAVDSMTRADLLPPERYALPSNERQRLQLHFSKNCIDWCFAGLITTGKSPKQARHYASMAIDGGDLLVLSRSGDEQAHDAHNGNFISFHRICDFRGLVY